MLHATIPFLINILPNASRNYSVKTFCQMFHAVPLFAYFRGFVFVNDIMVMT